MIESYKGRTVTAGQRVFAYRNLHKAAWSLRAVDGADKGKVVGHADAVILSGAEFQVSEAGRRRVIREGRKSVHAGVVGTIEPTLHAAGLLGTRVRYSPYEAGYFTLSHTGAAVMSAEFVDLDEQGKAYI